MMWYFLLVLQTTKQIQSFLLKLLGSQTVKKLLMLLILISFSTFAQKHNESVLQKSLKPWNPLSIEDNAGVITLVMNEDSVTTQIYNSVIRMGVCSALWLNPQKSAYLKNTKEVRVLNRHAHGGFVFEDPRSSCGEAGQAKGDDSELIIASHTHAF